VSRTLLGAAARTCSTCTACSTSRWTPLHPDVPLIFGSGILTGIVPSAARGNCTSWSPESGVIMDSNAGDYFPSFMRMNGIDHSCSTAGRRRGR
jgi:aldehyde:ferredoxin oxidoreductase